MVFFTVAIDIALIAFGFVGLSRVLQRKILGNEVIEKQADIKEKQARMKELLKKNDPQSQKEVEKVQTEMMESLNAMTKKQLKYMIMTFPIFILPFWYVQNAYQGQRVTLPIIGMELEWFWYYILMAIVGTLVISALVKVLKLEPDIKKFKK